MKKFLKPYLGVLLMGSLIATSSCGSDDDPAPTSDRELITTVTLSLTPQGKEGTPVVATIKSLDGKNPTEATLTLKAGTTYEGELLLLDEQETPAIKIHEEVLEEADDHQVFYTPNPQSLLTVVATDKDSKNRPVGLATTITAGTAGTGKLKVVLKHQPGTKAAAPGDATKGETDVEVEFNVIVQ
ncbi:MAG TPA: hypothetical protein VIG72_03210 [Pontibacter sp.]